MDYSKDLLDSQQGAAIDKFITEEWRYATAAVSSTTSVDSALKAMGVGGGGSSIDGGQHHHGIAVPKTTSEAAGTMDMVVMATAKCLSTLRSPVTAGAARLHSGLHSWRLESQVAVYPSCTKHQQQSHQKPAPRRGSGGSAGNGGDSNGNGDGGNGDSGNSGDGGSGKTASRGGRSPCAAKGCALPHHTFIHSHLTPIKQVSPVQMHHMSVRWITADPGEPMVEPSA
jgi:hypothetical protein